MEQTLILKKSAIMQYQKRDSIFNQIKITTNGVLNVLKIKLIIFRHKWAWIFSNDMCTPQIEEDICMPLDIYVLSK